MTELSSFSLAGKTALVTGAGRGLGRSIALALANAGADVALGLRDTNADGGLAEEITAMGRRALKLQMDVLDLKQAYAAIDEAIAEFGQLDILVNNVGGGTQGPVENFTEEEFDWTIDFSVKSTFFVSQYVGRHMLARKSGTIINMGSQAGAVALPGEAIYCLAKAAVSHMTKCFAVEWGKSNVRVNCVAPGLVYPTDASRGTREAVKDMLIAQTPLGRIATPDDV
ncbi:MAG: SDR family oxidoreductase, partial [Alphaproteobacteria bacterium]|nr:SDR family oxidoreductase [Alphaproteobacteria bacterium]